MSDCENCERLGKELAELRRAYGPDARKRLRALLDIAAERDRDLCAELDAANALLVRCEQHPDVQGSLKREIRAHLGGQSAPPIDDECPEADVEPPPTSAERRVLDAMAKAKLVIDRHHGRPIFEFSEDELAVCEAELARREAAKR